VSSARPGVEPEHLLVGHITKGHGTKGEVFIWPLTDRPEEVFAPGRELLVGDAEGGVAVPVEALVVERSRPFKRGMLVKFEARDDRGAVEPLAQRYVAVPASTLDPLAEGEVFYHQLLGMEVVTADGQAVGRVREVYETEPAHLLEVQGEAKAHLIPFAARIVRTVDTEAGRLVIEPPPGLLDL
jgi:16S rRNA processing protein RimM